MDSQRHGKEMSGDTDEYETWLCGIITTYVLYIIVTFSSVSDNWFSFWCLVDLYCLYVYRHIKTGIFISLSHPQHLSIMFWALTDPIDGSWMLTGWMLFINTLGPRQDGRHFADVIFTCIFFNENCCILIKLSLKYVRKGPINNNSALVQIMAWRRSGYKPLSEPMMISLPTHICVTRPQWVNLYIFFTSTLAPCTRYLLPRNINKTNPNMVTMADTYAYQFCHERYDWSLHWIIHSE